MTRNRIAGAIAAIAMLAAPAVASAHRGSDDNGRHHGRHHHAKKAKVKEVAGTVTSFTANELTITLASGKSYSGLVSDRTIIKCDTAAPAPTTQGATARASRHGDDDPASHDANDDRGGDNGIQGKDDDGRDDDGRDDDGVEGKDDHRGDDNGNGRCTTAALVAGAKVTEAKLSLKSDGATWKKVELLK
jgi:hypothetical protein